jgi:hypothetical protein
MFKKFYSQLLPGVSCVSAAEAHPQSRVFQVFQAFQAFHAFQASPFSYK